MPTLQNPIGKRTRSSRQWLRIVFGLVAVVVIVYSTWAIGVYAGSWRGDKSAATSRWMPLPAARVGWEALSLRSYLWHKQTIDHYTAYLTKSSPGVFGAGQSPDSRAVAMTKIIRDAATEKIAKQHQVSVSQTDLDQAYNTQLLQGGDREETTKAIKDLYNWTPDEFKRHVLRVAVIREKLREKLSFDDQLNNVQRQQANRVYELVKATPANFAEFAKQYSEDVYGAQGGDLGFFPRGEQDKDIDEVAFSLTVGEISELIHTKFGWHILLIEEKKELDGQEQVRARQIFIAAPNVDEYITAELQKRGVHILLKEFTWDEKTGQASVR